MWATLEVSTCTCSFFSSSVTIRSPPPHLGFPFPHRRLSAGCFCLTETRQTSVCVCRLLSKGVWQYLRYRSICVAGDCMKSWKERGLCVCVCVFKPRGNLAKNCFILYMTWGSSNRRRQGGTFGSRLAIQTYLADSWTTVLSLVLCSVALWQL